MERARRECILIEAAKCFARFGFKKASVDEIARGAGVAKGTVYLACDSKEDLFYQVLHREVRAMLGEIGKMIDPRVPADELLGRLSIAAVAGLEERPLVRDLFFGKTKEQLPRWAERLEELRALGTANVLEVLRLGVRQGIFRKDLDLESTSELLHDLQIAAYVFHANGPRREERFAQLQAAGLDLVLNGLRKAPRPAL